MCSTNFSIEISQYYAAAKTSYPCHGNSKKLIDLHDASIILKISFYFGYKHKYIWLINYEKNLYNNR